jgi:hypothetical protein
MQDSFNAKPNNPAQRKRSHNLQQNQPVVDFVSLL